MFLIHIFVYQEQTKTACFNAFTMNQKMIGVEL